MQARVKTRYPHRRWCLSVLPFLIALITLIEAATQGSVDPLYEGFVNPPSEFDLFPLWTWNGKIEVEEGKRQINEMMDKGIRRAIVYPFTNLRTRFLSEEWWKVWGSLLEYSSKKGFQLGVNAECEWPDGDARDKWMDPPDQSHVLEGHPEYRMQRLAYIEREYAGPGRAQFAGLPNPQIAVAARKTGPEEIDGESLVDLSQKITGSSFSAELAEGNWLLMFFYLEPTVGPVQGLRIDPLNRDAVHRFIDLTLGEYYRRFKQYVGKTLTYVLVDNEGEYGNPIAWTPGIFERFQTEKNYDLKRNLPLLVYEGGRRTGKVRIDYLRLISDLYRDNYWAQIARWSEEHGLQMIAQAWSDSLHYDAAYGGDFMDMMRALTIPGTEALGNRARSPREYKEAASVAHFEGKRYWCEGALVLGAKSYISPQKMRYSSNVMALWGIDLWSPQFYFDPEAVVYPPEVFISQPYWKYFRSYTDFVRRISYMNAGGRHVAHLLLYRPLDTVFAESSPLFREGQWGRGMGFNVDSSAMVPARSSRISDSGSETGAFEIDYPRVLWKSNFAAQAEIAYYDLMELLVGYQRDFDVVDDYYLKRADIKGRTFSLGNESFQGIILPPMKVISRTALARIHHFYEEGGIVISYGRLPSGSSEEGAADPDIATGVQAIFGIAPGEKRDAENRNKNGGRAYFLAGDIEKIVQVVDENISPDVQIAAGAPDRLLYLHRIKEGRDFYWIVNDTDQPRKATLSLSVQGRPELWDPTTGKKRDITHWVENNRTSIALELDAWDATYIVLQPEERAPRTSVLKTNLKSYTLEEDASGKTVFRGNLVSSEERAYVEGVKSGKPYRVEESNKEQANPQVLSPEKWRFSLTEKELEIRYARERLARNGEGEVAGFARSNYNDNVWGLVSLSPERLTVRDWWVLGPFPNADHEGYNHVYLPEKGIDLAASYTGSEQQETRWRRIQSARPEVNLTKALGIPKSQESVAYAMTWVYSPKRQEVQSRLVVKNGKFWVNGEQVFAMHSRPMYYELREPFGFQQNVTLKAGWNQVLVKVAGADRGPALIFSLRFCDVRGAPIEGLVTGWKPDQIEALREERVKRFDNFERWYRVDLPPGTTALRLPSRPSIQAVYLDGQLVRIEGTNRIHFPKLDYSKRPVLAIKLAARDELTAFLRFETGETDFYLGSWTRTGLNYYSGSAIYEKEFNLNPQFQGKQILLDFGQVGVAAEVWLNGQKVGERLWEPFVMDVSSFLKPGSNRLEFIVTNASDAAKRAIPDFQRYLELEEVRGSFISYSPPYMDTIDLNGLLGPVRLIPQRQVVLSIAAGN